MTQENQSAPSVGQEQASSGDSASLQPSQGQAPTQQNTGIETAQPGQVPPQQDWSAIQRQSQHAQQKITELAQARSQLEQRLQQMEQTQAQRNEALARALGYGQQEQSQPDVLSQLVDDPQWLEQKIQEIARQQVAPIQEQLANRDIEAYAANQAVEKNELMSELSSQVGKDMAEKIMSSISVSHLVPPEVLQMNQRLQNDPMLSPQEKEQMAYRVQNETWRALQKAGGYRELVNSALGKTLRSDLPGFIQSAARTYQQGQYSQGRTNSFGGMTGGAGTQSSSGGTSTISSESVYR